MSARAELWINEVLFNPPGTNDVAKQYVELRGPANFWLTNVYFVAVEGDTNGNPGKVQNIFDLTGRRIGGNGLLVLLQNSNAYAPSSAATVLANTIGPGFGSGANSSIKHRGKNGQVGFESASETFFLIQTTTPPDIGDDIDSDDNGLPDGPAFATWHIFDSVGVLDNDGIGDIAYGQINFRRDNAPGANAIALTGAVVPVNFTAGYVARIKNSNNWTSVDWVAGDNLFGAPPVWRLTREATSFAKLANKPLKHLGLPNFGGARLPGVIVREPKGGLVLTEDAAAQSYSLALNSRAAKGIIVQIDAPAGLELSLNHGRTYATSAMLKLAGTAPRSIFVRTIGNDEVASIPVRDAILTHTLMSSGDPAHYPLDRTVIPPLLARVADDERVVLSEIKANPPGPEDAPFEFVELRGTPNALLTNLQFVVVEGNAELNPGLVTTVVNLNGQRLGANGLLTILATSGSYVPLPETAVLRSTELDRIGGGLANGTVTFLLVNATTLIASGTDLDASNNGATGGLAPDAVIVDSIAWFDKSGDDAVYTEAVLETSSGKPDAVTRFSNNDTANSAPAWFGGQLAGTNAESLTYDERHVSTNFPFGTPMSPGVTNNTAPQISMLPPFTMTIGDPTTPPVRFTISDTESPLSTLTVSVRSSNQLVLPDNKISLSGSGAQRTLTFDPTGVGYSAITISVSDGTQVGERSFAFAASIDPIGSGRFHGGASDGSTVYAIDSKWMIIGDDETQLLRLYSRSNSGPPVVSFDINPFLGLEDYYESGQPREVDIEASTHVGNRIYWLGSHSHARDLEVRTNRARLFATDISGSGTNVALSFVAHYDYLKLDLVNWDAHNGHGKGDFYYGLYDSSQEGVDPKDPGGRGFNIEGLAMAPNSPNVAYVCFRAPLVPVTDRVKALIVPVTNFSALASQGGQPGSAVFGAPIELNLGGRGIRSIEAIGTNYLIVAGPPGIASNTPPWDFKLFTWTGNPQDQPQQRAADLTGMNVEGIVELPKLPWTEKSRVQLLSDNGITVYYGDDVQAKHLTIREFKKARTDWVSLGAVVAQSPFISQAAQQASTLKLTWYSVAGTRYRIQTTASFDGAWTDLPGDVVAEDAITTIEVERTDTQQFFRVVAVE